MTTPIAWPRKAREIHDAHVDSRAWNDFAFRDGDIVIATYAPSAALWMRHIVGQLLFGGAADVCVAALCPWVESGVTAAAETLARLAEQTHRRFVTTHLPVDALVYSPSAQYVCVDGGAVDGRAVRDGFPPWSREDHVRSWWAIRDLPNLLFVHVADLRKDLAGEIRRVAEFLRLPIYADRWPAILEHCAYERIEQPARRAEPALTAGSRTSA
jgi:aryl sulfotransferase